jgi:hypothetical protein
MLSEFLQELRRRRVIPVALIYTVCAGLAIQVAAMTFPMLDLPVWSLRLVLVLAVLGFAVALGLSWVYDITDTGVQRTPPREVTPAEIAQSYARIGLPGRPSFDGERARLLFICGALLVTVLSVAGWFVTAHDARNQAVPAQLDDAPVEAAPDDDHARP